MQQFVGELSGLFLLPIRLKLHLLYLKLEPSKTIAIENISQTIKPSLQVRTAMLKIKNYPRTRMQPQERVECILAHTAELVICEGVKAVTMERVSQLANVSRSLIYNYFKDTNEILISLFGQLRMNFRQKQTETLAKSHNFEELIRQTTRNTLRYYLENGELIVRLTNEPAIANVVLGTDEEKSWLREFEAYYSEQLVDRFKISSEVALTVFQVQQGVTESAALRCVRRLGEDGFEFLEELIFTSNMASLRAPGRKYGVSNQATVLDESWLEDAQSVLSDIANLIKQNKRAL